MRLNWKSLPACALIAAAGLLAAAGSLAQGWPSRPITLVIPFPPAGPTDVAGRIVAEKLGGALGQTVLVDNRSGANGNIGVQFVARAAPDGYTLLLGTGGTHGVNPTLYKNPGYDPVKSFAPVAWLMSTPNIIVANPQFPARTVAELIVLARREPGKISVAVPGIGSTPHMAGELFKRTADIDIRAVPYRGSAAGLTDVIAGQLPLMFDGIPSALPQINAGKLRAIAVTGARRAPELPDVPTVAESMPGFEVNAWFGIYAPAG
ncbi:MAG: tripartite tricarboxylate transporter substrate binding protein, partial [Burkholderiaceae bacterium]|nr:tripartite tricarboxylate transporter substrate binding protein [Burkholderiaceae bacterium]